MFGPGGVALKDGIICRVSWLSVRSRNITRAASLARKVNINYQAVSIHYLKDTLLPKWDTSHGLLHKRLMKVAIGTSGAGPFKRYLAGDWTVPPAKTIGKSNCPDPIWR